MRKAEITREASVELLQQLYRKETNPRIKERILMIIHVKEGKSALEVSEMLFRSPNTVLKWVRMFNRKGIQGLRDKDRQGRPRKVDYEDLKAALEKKPSEYGYEYTAWFPKLVYNYLIDFQHVELAFDYIYRLIRRLGYSLVVPRTKSYKSDDEKVLLFKKKVRKL